MQCESSQLMHGASELCAWQLQIKPPAFLTRHVLSLRVEEEATPLLFCLTPALKREPYFLDLGQGRELLVPQLLSSKIRKLRLSGHQLFWASEITNRQRWAIGQLWWSVNMPHSPLAEWYIGEESAPSCVWMITSYSCISSKSSGSYPEAIWLHQLQTHWSLAAASGKPPTSSWLFPEKVSGSYWSE